MDNINSFNRNRLKFARKKRGLTITSFSNKLGITNRTLSSYENGGYEPSEDKLILIANELKFPINFFYRDDLPDIQIQSVSFRALSRISASSRNKTICSSQIALEFNKWIENKFDLPESNLPDLSAFQPEVAAEAIRDEWTIGQRPIANMIHLLESKGVRVFSLSEDTFDMDAYSFWMDNTPYVFLNTMKSVERGRFDASHELGHLLLHKHGGPLGKEAETQANKFASAFLMPKSSVLAHANKFPTIDKIITLKKKWKVSASALIHRLKDLELLTEWIYRNLIIQLSSRESMKNEPNPIIEKETSKLLSIVFEELKKDGINKKTIAKDLGFFVDEINSIVFNLTMFGHLRIVK